MSSSGRAVSPPHLSTSPRSGGGSAARVSGEMAHDLLDDARRGSQMEHDLDAARAMSRARANSNVGRSAMPTTSPRSIPYHARHPSDNPDMLPGPAMDFDETRAGSSGNAATMGGTSTSPRHAFTLGNSPAALRHQHFYHHRQGSNTSLDSANHFIDHRSNQLASSYVPSPSRLHSNYSAASNGGAAFGRSLNQRGAATRSPHALRAGMSPGEEAVAEDEGPHVDDIHRAAARRRASRASGARDDADLAVPGTPHTMSRRPSMLEDDVCFPMTTPGDELTHEHLEGGMHHTPRNALGGDEHDHDMHHHHAGQERCPPGYPFTFDLSALETFAAEERTRLEAGATATSSSWAANGLRQRSAATLPIAPRGAEAAQGAERAAAYAVSPDSDDATFYSRRPRRFAPADGTDAGGGSSRYQRKLALFEGGSSATSPPPIPVSGRPTIMGNGLLVTADADRARANSAAADAKTPLLAGGSAPSYDAGRYDEASKQHLPQPQGRSDSFVHPRDRRRNTTAFGARSTTEKPYRFTFYSNALPSTIHARHLAELPAPGQTFEELFSGLVPETPSNEQTRAPTPGETATEEAGSGGSGARPANRQASALSAQLGRMEGNTAPPTGANTPELASAPLGGPAPSVAGQSGFQRASGANLARNSSVPANAGRVIPGGGIRMDQDPEANTWWLDVLSPTDQEMKLLSRVSCGVALPCRLKLTPWRRSLAFTR
jgi:magnesium transporter